MIDAEPAEYAANLLGSGPPRRRSTAHEVRLKPDTTSYTEMKMR